MFEKFFWESGVVSPRRCPYYGYFLYKKNFYLYKISENVQRFFLNRLDE